MSVFERVYLHVRARWILRHVTVLIWRLRWSRVLDLLGAPTPAAKREAARCDFLAAAKSAAHGDYEAARTIGGQGLDLIRLSESAGPAAGRLARDLVLCQLRMVRASVSA